MNVLVTGATGTIGRPLCTHLLNKRFVVSALTQNKKSAAGFVDSRIRLIEWNPYSGEPDWTSCLTEERIDAVINLAGENLSKKRWSKAHKERILKSRIAAARTIVNAVREKKIAPHTLVNASAVGYYGFHPDHVFNEDDSAGEGFLSRVCEEWETEAAKAGSFGVRVVRMRTGMVLSRDGGTLKEMLPVIKMNLGGYFGRGSQWFSWIHVEDMVRAIQYILEREDITGPVNMVSPEPATNKQFVKVIGKVLGKPTIFSIPRFIIWLRFGEMADLLYKSQRASPKRLLEAGFSFLYNDIEKAVEHLLGSN